MPLRQLEQLFQSPIIRKYPKGQILLYAGNEISNIYFLKRGYVKMYSINEQGEERILLIFSPNTAFPIFPGVMEQPHYKIKYFYETMDDAELYLVPKQQFGKLLACNDEAARLALEYVTGMAGDLVRRLGIIENKDAKNKIASLLHYLIKIGSREIKPNQYKVKFRLTHQDIAALSGITRETASIQIKNLEDDGVISQKKDGLLLINQELIPV